MNYNVAFCGKEKLITIAKEAEKMVKSTTHEYKSNSMLGITEDSAKKVSEKKDEIFDAVRAKYAPYTVESNKVDEITKLAEDYKRARGIV